MEKNKAKKEIKDKIPSILEEYKKYKEASTLSKTQKFQIQENQMIIEAPFIRGQTLELQAEILSLVKDCIKIHKTAIKALSDADKKNALLVIKMDNEIDVKYSEIIKDATFLFTQQPFARELRRVIGYIEIAKSLEWIGDCSVKIAKFIIAFQDKISESSQKRIKKLHNLLYKSMLKISSIIERENISDSMKLAKKDALIDETILELSTAIINSIANKKKITLIDERVYVLKILNSLEIAADHIVNICEIVIYIKTGILTNLN